MAFSFVVEILNMVVRKRQQNRRIVNLNQPVLPTKEPLTDDMAH